MKAFLTFLILSANFASAYDRFDDLGVLSSSEKREPQVIRVQRSDDGSNLIQFKFCETIESDRCESLGRKEGYTDTELEKLSQVLKLDAKTMTYLKPLYVSSIFLAGIGITALSGGTAIPLMSTAFSASLGQKVIDDMRSEPEAFDRLGKVSNPRSLFFPMKLKEEISIVSLSYLFERKLKALENPCFIESKTYECQEWKTKSLEDTKEIGKRFQYYLK